MPCSAISTTRSCRGRCGRSRARKGLSRSFPNEFEGSIAESWSFERDGATIVLKIRPGMKFPSGRPIDAAVLKYSLDRALQSPGYMRFIMPRMIQVIQAGGDRGARSVDHRPRHEGADAAAHGAELPVADDHHRARSRADQAQRDREGPVGGRLGQAQCGRAPVPIPLTANTPGVEVVLEARKDHWRGTPAFQKIVLKFVPNEADRVLLLKRKAIDLVIGRPGLSPRNIKTFENEKDFRIVTVPDTTCHWLAMNQTKKPLDNVKVRQAINYAIPVAAIVPNVLMGYGSAMKSPVPALTPGHDGTLSPYKYDLDKAKALMKEAGVTTPVALDLAVRIGWQPHEEAAVWIQRELEKIGFKINITRQTDATFRQLADQGRHAALDRDLAVVGQRSVLPHGAAVPFDLEGHQHGVLRQPGVGQDPRRELPRAQRR